VATPAGRASVGPVLEAQNAQLLTTDGVGNSGGRDPDEMDVEEIEAGLVPEGDSDDDAMDDSARGQVPKRRRGAA
jgi:hypothetical protein